MIQLSEKSKRRFTAALNEHINNCQICQQGNLCDKAEALIEAFENQIEQQKQENQAQKIKRAGL